MSTKRKPGRPKGTCTGPRDTTRTNAIGTKLHDTELDKVLSAFARAKKGEPTLTKSEFVRRAVMAAARGE
jgi:hypothetical protein